MPSPILPLTVAEEDHFWSLAEKGDGCWAWKGCVKGGSRDSERGVVSLRGEGYVAARVAWALTHKAEPDGFVCHSCDNPNCVNPDHLWLGDARANMIDCRDKGRHPFSSASHCANGHEFTPENTLVTKAGHRRCRACKRTWNAAYRAQRRESLLARRRYPAWICSDCGHKYGRVINGHCATFHEGDACGWCGRKTITTEPRDYGYPVYSKAVRLEATGDHP